MDLPVRIPIRISRNKAYVWEVDDIAILRSKHHICGILTGTLPHLSQQNVFLGLPLVLMPEEVVLLVDKEFAILVDDPTAHAEPSISQLERWDDGRKKTVKQQIAHADAKETKEVTMTGRAMTEAAVQKRKEREEKKARKFAFAAEIASGIGPGPISAPGIVTPKGEKGSDAPAPSVRDTSHVHPHTVVVPTTSSFEWYRPEGHTYSTISSAKAAGIWDFPATLHERARCGVFQGLWEQGYFMGSGIKFGGDYLVYPGDPLRYHSHFTASILDSPVSPLRAMEIVAHGRLGTATKKAHLLCGWDDGKQEVSYLSIEWAGFG